MKILLFDDILKTRSGKLIPYYHQQPWGNDDESDVVDQAELWFHEGYGLFQKYRLHDVDGINYICEPLKQFKRN